MTDKPIPSSVPVLKRVIFVGLVGCAVLAVVLGALFWILVGPLGAISALIGAVMAAIFLAITALSIVIATRFDMVAFFAIVLGSWLFKFVLFIVLALTLKAQPWVNPLALFISLICGVLLSLIADVVVVTKTRMPYVSDLAK